MAGRKGGRKPERAGTAPAKADNARAAPASRLGRLARDTVVFLALWVIGFLATRLFCYSAYPLEGGGLGRVLILGLAWDLGAAAAGWLAVVLLQVLFPRRLIGRYSILIVLVPALLLGTVNALFVAWAHAPLDASFLGYIDSLGSLAGSARGLLPEWYWVAAFAIATLAVWGAAWLYGFRRAAALGLRWRAVVAAAVIIAVLLGLSLAFHAAWAQPSTDAWAMAANPIWQLIDGVINSRSGSLGKWGGGAADRIREALVTDAGAFNYLDEEYPLMKFNVLFSRPGKRKDVWDRSRQIRPNVVILFLESFRAQDVGAYGSKARLTPTFDALAEKGWLWENFYANGVQTPRAALATLCSLHPHFGKSVGRSNPSLRVRGLASILKEQGYQTEFYHNGSLSFDNKTPFFGNIGFDVILGMGQLNAEGKYDTFGGWGYADAIFAEQLADRLNRQPADKPLLLTAFTVSTHHPYEVPDERFKIVPETGGQHPKYQNCVHYSDHALDVFFGKLEKKALENTIFVVMADTCQPMGEHHNNFALVRYLYEENVRVPFLIYAPGYIKQPRRFSEVASQVDIMPTLLDMLGVRCANAAVGRSLLAAAEDPVAIFSNPYFEGWVGIRKGRYKYVLQVRRNVESLYDLQADPDEKRNIVSSMPGVAAELRRRAKSAVEAGSHLIEHGRVWNPSAAR